MSNPGLDAGSDGRRALGSCLAALTRSDGAELLKLLGETRIDRLARMGVARLGRSLGLAPGDAQRLHAAFELGRLVEEERVPFGVVLATPGQVWRAVAPRLRGLDREVFEVLLLDGKHRLLRVVRVSVGTLTASLVHPREVFAPAVGEPAAALIAVHNHPSGDPEPSREDIEVTGRLVRAGKLLGLPLLDHIVVGGGRFVSLRERLDFAELESGTAALLPE